MRLQMTVGSLQRLTHNVGKNLEQTLSSSGVSGGHPLEASVFFFLLQLDHRG